MKCNLTRIEDDNRYKQLVSSAYSENQQWFRSGNFKYNMTSSIYNLDDERRKFTIRQIYLNGLIVTSTQRKKLKKGRNSITNHNTSPTYFRKPLKNLF